MNKTFKIVLTVFLSLHALTAFSSLKLLYYGLTEPTSIYSDIFVNPLEFGYYIVAPISALLAVLLGWFVSERFFWLAIPSILVLLYTVYISIGMSLMI